MVLHFAFFFFFSEKKKRALYCCDFLAWAFFYLLFVQYDGLTSAKIFFLTEDPLFFSLFVSWVTKGNFFFLKKKKKKIKVPNLQKNIFSHEQYRLIRRKQILSSSDSSGGKNKGLFGM